MQTTEFEILLPQDELEELNYAIEQAKQELVTVRDFIRFGVSQMRKFDVFVGQGTNDHFAESSAMVMQTLSLEWSADPEILDAKLIASEKEQVLAILHERISTRRPLSYILNLSYFCELPFYVDERVLIPRSPIAELIKQNFYPYFAPTDTAKPLLAGGDEPYFAHGLTQTSLPAPERILDLCTGSACIAIALAKYYEEASVDAVDLDDDALDVATLNVEHHNLGHQVELIKSDLFSSINPEEQYNLIVTNPPYVDAQDMADLPLEFVHEPAQALAAGQDGLDLVHFILHDAPAFLADDGLLVVEVGNSAWALNQSYPQITFNWLKFLNGGMGIFAITKAELLEHRELFKQHCLALQG